MVKRTLFKPCIDLHEGQVKQIVGGTLSETDQNILKTNFISSEPIEYYTKLYQENELYGCHIIKLGSGNDDICKRALKSWPKRLQVGGGITLENAKEWLELGAEKVIVTSWLFKEGKFSWDRLIELEKLIGKQNLVLDLSCKWYEGSWRIAINKWQTVTEFEVNQENITKLENYCSEFLIHSVAVEGLCQGVDQKLIQDLSTWVTIPTTYAGGASSINDLKLVDELSKGKIDLTFGSALDLFGGNKVKFEDCVKWNKKASE